MSNDVWAQAAQQTAPASNGQPSDNLASAMPETESQLFTGGPSYPSLFNKTHLLGTELTGIITKVQDVQGRDFDTKQPATWPDGSPKMDTHITVSTDYRMTAQECAAIDRDPSFVQEDDGTRVFVAGGFNLKTVREAIKRDAPGLGVTRTADLVGKRITVKRAGQTQRGQKGNKSWDLEVRFSRP